MALLKAFFLSARASVNVMMPAATSVFTCSVMIALLHITLVDWSNSQCYLLDRRAAE
jgi:hypothetical protein